MSVYAISKSTMIKLIRGELQPQEGVCRLNPHARAVQFTQHHIDQLDLTQSTMDYLQYLFPQAKEHQIRGVMSAAHTHTSGSEGPVLVADSQDHDIGRVTHQRESVVCVCRASGVALALMPTSSNRKSVS